MSMAPVALHLSRRPAVGSPFLLLRMCLVEARPSVLAIFLVRFLAGVALAAVAIDDGHPTGAIACGATWLLAIFSIYLFNGVMDIAEDQINGSRRPIASGVLDPETATWVAVVAAALAVGGGIWFGLPTVWTVPILLALGYLYSGPPLFLKRRPIGTALTGTIAGLMTYHAGFVSYGSTGRAEPDAVLLIFAVIMSLWIGLVGPPTKDLADVAGDAASGRRTLAVVCRESTVRFGAAAAAVGLAAVFMLVAVRYVPMLVLPAAVMLIGASGVALLLSLGRCPGDYHSARRRPYRAFMTTQFAVHLSLLSQLAEAYRLA